jgi:putative transposase
MARPLRLEFAGALYHLSARGDRREPIFVDDEDRLRFLELLAKEVSQQGWLLYAYCLMGNHYHLLLETPEPNLVRGMRRLNGVYTQAFNRRHGLVGHLFQGRYKAILVDKESYLLELSRYLVLNPVRAKLVASAKDWPWSSYLATVGKRPGPQWLAAEQLLALFAKNEAAARRAYERFVAERQGLASPWERLSGQIFLGGEAFLKKMQKLASGKPASNVPRSQRSPLRPRADEVLKAIARAYGLPTKKLLDRSHPEAFKAAVYLLRRQANLTLGQVAKMAAISAPRVSQIQTEIETEGADKVLTILPATIN